MPLLSVDSVSFKYGEQWVLRGIGFEVEKGQLDSIESGDVTLFF